MIQVSAGDTAYMKMAIALSDRGRGRTGSNPNVGAILVKNGRVVGRGHTADGGRPHAEAAAFQDAGDRAKDATLYVTLEPCAHKSARGPSCADLVIAAGVAKVVIARTDPDPRTAGQGTERIRNAGIEVALGVAEEEARRVMAGFFMRMDRGRPHVTLKLAMSLDGCIALADGSSKWITGEAARAHGHMERARCDAILVGSGTVKADEPRLDVRLPGLERYSPKPVMLGRGEPPKGWASISVPSDISGLEGVNWLMIEGGAGTAASFLKPQLVDRLMIYRAPILIGGGLPGLGDFGLTDLASAHGKWAHIDHRMLGKDSLDVYEAVKI